MIRVGLYGTNGHQIQNALAAHPLACLAATCGVPVDKLPPGLNTDASIRSHETFEQLLADPGVDLVSLCSPRRIEQATDAVRALSAGKHVLAEKPCAMSEADLDAIIEATRKTGKCFHEMAGTAFDQPYWAMRGAVRSGILGAIVQVIAEKSYPYYDGRAQDEDLDGGQIMQNGIHALRFVEHVAGAPIASVQAVETLLGNPVEGGGLRMAASMVLTLENGGVASIANNYLNPRGTGVWGYESLKILGVEGMVESRAGGAWTRLVVGDKDLGPLDTTGPGLPWLEAVFGSILGLTNMPLTLEEELSPTRWAIRAKRGARRD